MDYNRTNNHVSGEEGEKFVPTCSICGEKHWPHHPLAPCFNAKKVREKAKAEAAARALAEKQARIDAKLQAKEQARADKLAKIEARKR